MWASDSVRCPFSCIYMSKMTDKEVKAWGDSIGVPNCDKKRNFLSVFREYSSVGGWGEWGNGEELMRDPCASCKFKEERCRVVGHEKLDPSKLDPFVVRLMEKDGVNWDKPQPVYEDFIFCKKYKEERKTGSHPARALADDDCRGYELNLKCAYL